MKLPMNNDIINKILSQVRSTSQRVYQAALSHIEKLNKQQRLIALVTGGVLLLLLLVVALGPAKPVTTTRKSPIRFETLPVSAVHETRHYNANPNTVDNLAKLQSQIAELQSLVYHHDATLQNQREATLARLSSLASQHDVRELVQHVAERNSQLLSEIARLQDSVKVLTKQTKKTQWVSAQLVEHYFKLVAVQGFSDGMRAIIDVDGNQTALSVNEICPACRGWVLHSMNFADQSAVFSKHVGDKTLYLVLRVN